MGRLVYPRLPRMKRKRGLTISLQAGESARALLVQQSKPENLLEDCPEDAVAAVGITAVLRTAVIAVFVTPAKAFPEVVLILR